MAALQGIRVNTATEVRSINRTYFPGRGYMQASDLTGQSFLNDGKIYRSNEARLIDRRLDVAGQLEGLRETITR